jgi:hypothetical protein
MIPHTTHKITKKQTEGEHLLHSIYNQWQRSQASIVIAREGKRREEKRREKCA